MLRVPNKGARLSEKIISNKSFVVFLSQKKKKMKGKLYLLPCPLGDDALQTIPPYVVDIIHRLDYFICEKAKTARHFIKETGLPRPLQELTIMN